MKPSPERLRPETYPVGVIVSSRFRDLDTLGHLNNVAIGSFYEEGRGALNRAVFDEARRAGGFRVLIADVHIAYLAEAFYPGDCEVRAGVLSSGRSSYVIALAIFQNGTCVGTCETVMVHVDANGPAPLGADDKAAMARFALRA
ncbi:acyl-CoA thioesterase [Glycocaulis profundi]|nr:acyl-CoA thioesterase [Glycocaulis profundi]